MENLLKIINLKVKAKDKEILKGIELNVKRGEIHIIIGPNGSGKSVLAHTIMGNPLYKIIEGNIIYKGQSISSLPPEERAKRGIFLSFQDPPEIEYIKMLYFLKEIYKRFNSKHKGDFKNKLEEILKEINLDKNALSRGVNENLSGGEKKKSEIIQMMLLNPELAILDEIDTGLDIESIKKFAKIIKRYRDKRRTTFLIITHNPKIIKYVDPDKVHILIKGKIIYSTSNVSEIEDVIEHKGYGTFL